jgi:hypothetical protein
MLLGSCFSDTSSCCTPRLSHRRASTSLPDKDPCANMLRHHRMSARRCAQNEKVNQADVDNHFSLRALQMVRRTNRKGSTREWRIAL